MIASRLKADDVVFEQGANQIAVARQRAQRLDVRKRNVQEEAERPRHAASAQLASEIHQVVVVNPNEIVIAQERHEPLGEQPVHAHIGVELRPRVAQPCDEVMAQRPERAVAEAGVVEVEVVPRQVEGRELDVVPRGDADGTRAVGRDFPLHPNHMPPCDLIAASMPTARPPAARDDAATRFDTATSRVMDPPPRAGSGGSPS